MKNLIKFVFRLFLIFLGIIILSIYVWNRYIREKLPKELPINLSTIGVFVISLICIIYLINIVQLVLKLDSNNKFIKKFSELIFKPLTTLDDAIKNNHKIKPYYENLLVCIIKFSQKYISKQFANPYLKLYIIFEITPRIVLITAFVVDIFFFHELYYIYKVIYISIFILLGKYLKYSYKSAKENYLMYLEKITENILTNHTMDDEDPMYLNIRSVQEFVDIQTDAIIFDDKEYTYLPVIKDTYVEQFRIKKNLSFNAEQHQFTITDITELQKDFYHVMRIIIPLSVYLEEYHYAEKYSRTRYTKVVIFSLYLICWLYILIISLNLDITNYPTIMEILKIFKDISEPFSGLFL